MPGKPEKVTRAFLRLGAKLSAMLTELDMLTTQLALARYGVLLGLGRCRSTLDGLGGLQPREGTFPGLGALVDVGRLGRAFLVLQDHQDSFLAAGTVAGTDLYLSRLFRFRPAFFAVAMKLQPGIVCLKHKSLPPRKAYLSWMPCQSERFLTFGGSKAAR